MYRFRITFLISFAFFLTVSLAGQQSSTSSVQALSLLQKSLAALTGGQSINDITLSGTARRIAGSDDETGSVTMKVLMTRGGRIDFSFPSGLRSDIRNFAATPPGGAWSGPDGTLHAIAYHNFLSEPVWFAPVAAVATALSNANYVSTYVGHETRNDGAVEHITVNQQLPGAVGDTSFFQKLSQLDLYLDSATLLPLAMDFCVHPDTNAAQNIPIEVLFSDYRVVNGMQMPFHVERFANNTLVYDLQIQNVSINSGLSASQFEVQ
jgi:hypothetical protein